MEAVKEIIHNIPVGAIWALIGGYVISFALQLLKRWLAVQSEKVINFLLGALSFAAVAIQYLTTAVSQNPSVLGTRTTAVVTGALAAYHLKYIGIKDMTQVLKDAKEYRERKARIATENAPQTLVPLDTVQPQVPLVEAPVAKPAPVGEFQA